MDLRYGENHRKNVYYSRLKNLCQKLNESLQEFEADVARVGYVLNIAKRRDAGKCNENVMELLNCTGVF